MALIRCPDCGHSVSNQARTCPNCGYPLREVEYRTHEVITFGALEARGQVQLDALLEDGWRIIDEDGSDTWVTGDGYEARRTVYRLRR
jgi:hypothetical protein